MVEIVITIYLTIIVLAWSKTRNIYFAKTDTTIKQNTTVSERNTYFDIIRGIAIIGVILIHVSDFHFHETAQGKSLFIYYANNLSRFVIPLFLISSGILLNPNSYKKGQRLLFYLKKINRIFIPYLLVSSFVFFFYQYNIPDSLKSFIKADTSVPYYYIIVLLQLYLIYPFLIKFKNTKEFLPISFLFSLICFLNTNLWMIFGIPFFGKYLFFFAYGIYHRETFLNYKKNQTHLWFWTTLIFIYFLNILIQPEYFYNVRLFYGIAVFQILFYFKENLLSLKKTAKFLQKFGQNSLWIFLTHFFFVEYYFYLLKDFTPNYYLNFVLIFAVSIITSYYFAFGCMKLYNFGFRKMISTKR